MLKSAQTGELLGLLSLMKRSVVQKLFKTATEILQKMGT